LKEREDPREIVFLLNKQTADFITSNTSTDPLGRRGIAVSGQRRFARGIICCFFGNEIVASKDFRFSDDDDDNNTADENGIDDDGVDGNDVDIFASLWALFHKIFTLLRSSYR